MIAVSLMLSPLAAGTGAVLEKAYAALSAAFASYASFEHPALQGVEYADGISIFPERISFIRSDISTYEGSFQFFSSGSSSAMSIYRMLVPQSVYDRIGADGIQAGDFILDGVVRFHWLSEEAPEHFALLDDWTGAEVSVSLSLVVTGRISPEGTVIEGDVILRGGNGRTVTADPEDSIITVDGSVISIDPSILIVAMFGGGQNGQVQRIS